MGRPPAPRDEEKPVHRGLRRIFFGGIGLGVYFRSWKDAIYPTVGIVLLSIAFPVIGTVTALVLTAIWGVARASD